MRSFFQPPFPASDKSNCCRNQDEETAVWHCCYAPCPCADRPGMAATLLSFCQASGAQLSTRILWHPTASAEASRPVATASLRSSSHPQQQADRPAQTYRPADSGMPWLPHVHEVEDPDGTSAWPAAESGHRSGAAARHVIPESSSSKAERVLQELQSIRAAAASAAGQEALGSCRLVVTRLGFMDEQELSGWSVLCHSLSPTSSGRPASAHCKHVGQLLVACCNADSCTRCAPFLVRQCHVDLR